MLLGAALDTCDEAAALEACDEAAALEAGVDGISGALPSGSDEITTTFDSSSEEVSDETRSGSFETVDVVSEDESFSAADDVLSVETDELSSGCTAGGTSSNAPAETAHTTTAAPPITAALAGIAARRNHSENF